MQRGVEDAPCPHTPTDGDCHWSFRWLCRVTRGASREGPAGYQPSRAAPSNHARLRTPPPGLPGDLAKLPPGRTGCPQGPSVSRCPCHCSPAGARLPGLGAGRLPCGDRAESPACPGSTSAGTIASEQGSRPSEATLIFKVTAVTEVTSPLGSCPPDGHLGLRPRDLTMPLPTALATPSTPGGLELGAAAVDVGGEGAGPPPPGPSQGASRPALHHSAAGTQPRAHPRNAHPPYP